MATFKAKKPNINKNINIIPYRIKVSLFLKTLFKINKSKTINIDEWIKHEIKQTSNMLLYSLQYISALKSKVVAKACLKMTN